MLEEKVLSGQKFFQIEIDFILFWNQFLAIFYQSFASEVSCTFLVKIKETQP